MKVSTYDPKCYELAKQFLSDTPVAPGLLESYTHDLALDIQKVIEDFIEAERLDL